MANYFRKEEVMKLVGCKKDKALQIIRDLNKELEAKGYITIRGQIPENYLRKRLGLYEE